MMIENKKNKNTIKYWTSKIIQWNRMFNNVLKQTKQEKRFKKRWANENVYMK